MRKDRGFGLSIVFHFSRIEIQFSKEISQKRTHSKDCFSPLTSSPLIIIQGMNNDHSNHELFYRKRWIGSLIQSGTKTFPVVIVSGARQVGKSTFLQNEFPDFKYLSLDDFSALHQTQRAPEIFSAVKLAVDRNRRKIRFLISGSSNLLRMKGISETLAGRAIYFEMHPMTYGEMYGKGERPQNFLHLLNTHFKIKEQDLKEVDPVPLMLKGFMPPLLHLSEGKDVLLWWEGYVKTYLERDLRELSQIESLVDFRRVLESLALRTRNLLNQTEVSRDTGVSQPTVYRYIKLLEISNLFKRIPAYFPSQTKRITKSPKCFFVDPGLSIYLS